MNAKTKSNRRRQGHIEITGEWTGQKEFRARCGRFCSGVFRVVSEVLVAKDGLNTRFVWVEVVKWENQGHPWQGQHAWPVQLLPKRVMDG